MVHCVYYCETDCSFVYLRFYYINLIFDSRLLLDLYISIAVCMCFAFA